MGGLKVSIFILLKLKMGEFWLFDPKLINDKNIVINLICISKNKISIVENLVE